MADRIKVIVAEMLERRIKDPRLGFVTVTDVRVTGDTQHATVFYTVLGRRATGRHGRRAGVGHGLIRSEVGKQLGLRHTPTLTFIPDAVPENARQIEELLAQATVGGRPGRRASGRRQLRRRGRPLQGAPADEDDDDDGDDER